MEKNIKEFIRKISCNHWQIYQKNINDHLDIKLRYFTGEKLEPVLKNIKNRKATGFGEISSEVWKTWIFDEIFLWLYNAVYKQKSIEKWTKGRSSPSSRETGSELQRTTEE